MIPKINKRIEIVRAHNVRYSSMGLQSAQMIQRVLSQYYVHVGLSTVANQSDLELLVAKQPDLVFLGLKRIHDGKSYIWLSEYLDSHGVNYTGSSKPAMELDLNKVAAKERMQQSGIATAGFFTAKPRQFKESGQLPLNFPLFIKPYDQGGGMGIGPDSIARTFTDFTQKVQSIYDDYGAFSLVEEYLDGREFSVGLLGDGYGEELAAMPIELITKPNEFGDRILGQAVKQEDNERAIYIGHEPTRDKIAQLGRTIYAALGARDFGRIDIRMNGAGKPFFIEANLNPGLAHHDFVSYFTRACALNNGINYEAMVLRIVEIGLVRGVGGMQTTFEPNAANHLLHPLLEPVLSPSPV